MDEVKNQDKFAFDFPLWLVANDARHNSVDFFDFCARATGGEFECVYLFTTQDLAERFIADEPSCAQHRPIALKDSAILLRLLDDLERRGISHAAFDAMPRAPAKVTEFARIRLAAGTGN